MENSSLAANDSVEHAGGETTNSPAKTQGAGLPDSTVGIVANSLLLPLILAGNSLVMAAYAKNHRLRNGTYLFLASLALSDALVGSVALPIRIYGSIKKWQVNSHLLVFYNAFDIFSAVASNLHLISISFERFIAVSRPFYYQTISVRPYVFACALSWGLAVFVAVAHPGNYLLHESDFLLKTKILRVHMVLLFVACFVGPLLVISIVNIAIFRVAKALIQRTPSQYIEIGRRIRRERKTAITLLLVTGFFFIAWFPFFVVNILYFYCRVKCLPSSIATQFLLVDIVKWLHYSNSAVNPAIYAFRDVEMRKSFARLLGPVGKVCCVRQISPEIQSTENTFEIQLSRRSLASGQ